MNITANDNTGNDLLSRGNDSISLDLLDWIGRREVVRPNNSGIGHDGIE